LPLTNHAAAHRKRAVDARLVGDDAPLDACERARDVLLADSLEPILKNGDSATRPF
jgi:hypothetical protein